jgi:putative PIN family toxin of toxin-antitoxin system
VRAVLDANVLVSSLLSRTDAPARLVELWLAGEFELVVCETLLEEVERTLAHPKIAARVSAADAADFVRVVRELAELVPDPTDRPQFHSADPGDDYLLALAARERTLLVSGDAHVLALADRLPVLSSREFLNRLNA